MKLKDTLRSIIREEVKRILKENAVPKSGIKITDDDLEKKNILSVEIFLNG